MYWLDSAILVVLALAALLGARSGFVRQIARLVALGVALYGAIRLHDQAFPLLEESFLTGAPSWVVHGAAYAVVFVLLYALLLTVSLFLDRGVRAANARWLDRILGALLGAGKAAIGLGLLFLALAECAPDVCEGFLDNSALVPRLSAAAQHVVDRIPPAYREDLQAQLREAVGGVD